MKRLFRICPFSECRNIGLFRRLAEHTIAGGILGFWLLHPLSMVAHNVFHIDDINIWKVIMMSFSYGHISMTVFFTTFGAVFGLIHGSYIHVISKLYEEIRMMAVSDELTSLYNRRFLINRLDQEVVRALRYRHPLSLLMIDIDFFKQYNDRNGHQAGDALLKTLARQFGLLGRETDIMARYGGEEFIIVMPETGAEMAGSLAQRICATVADYPFHHRERQPGGRVTISIGVAELPADAMTAEELIRKADQALYRAKQTGKNRVCDAAAGESSRESDQTSLQLTPSLK